MNAWIMKGYNAWMIAKQEHYYEFIICGSEERINWQILIFNQSIMCLKRKNQLSEISTKSQVLKPYLETFIQWLEQMSNGCITSINGDNLFSMKR